MADLVGRDGRWPTGIECYRNKCEGILEAYVLLTDTGRPSYKYMCNECKHEGSWMEVIDAYGKYGPEDYRNKRKRSSRR